jgi:hypothetical protein
MVYLLNIGKSMLSTEACRDTKTVVQKLDLYSRQNSKANIAWKISKSHAAWGGISTQRTRAAQRKIPGT